MRSRDAALAALCGAIGGGLAVLLALRLMPAAPSISPPAAGPPVAPQSAGPQAGPAAGPRPMPASFAGLARRAGPAVVYISTTQVVVERPAQWSPFLGILPERDTTRTSLGTGFLIDPDGYILTNNHVVANAAQVDVTLADGRVLSARIIGLDPPTDLALLKVEAPGSLPTLPLGDSAHLEVGEWVIAIGNPFGLEKTVTAGIVSAKGRSGQRIEGGGPQYQDFIQTDAAINPGNSGGPLIDMEGRVIGVSSAVNRDAQGIGFAIPIDLVKRVVPLLERDGRISRAALDILVHPVTAEIAARLGLPKVEGALVWQVRPDGPAAQAGLQPGDVILQFDGQDVDETSLRLSTSLAGVGHRARLTVYRDHALKSLTITLAPLAPMQ